MHTKLAGHLSLQDMISAHINSAQEKLSAAEDKREKKEEKKEDEKEKKSFINPSDPGDVEKLAEALEYIGDMVKEADTIELGGEKAQGGTVLPVASPLSGKQVYKHDKAKTNPFPPSQKTVATKDNPGAATANPADDERAPGGNNAKYPAKGVLKTAAEGVMDKIRSAKVKAHAKTEGESEEEAAKEEKKMKGGEKESKEKESSVDYILGKVAFTNIEKQQGGMTLDFPSGEGPKPETGGSNSARSHIESNQAATNMKKVEGKNPQKKQLHEVLKEPAQSKSTDSKVHENLRNASKGGVKIAAARAFLAKVAEGGCTCDDGGACRFCKLQVALDSKKDGGSEQQTAEKPEVPAETK